MRDTPCAARGAEPLAFCSWRWGVAGRVDLPAEVGGGGPKGRSQGGNLIPLGGILPQILATFAATTVLIQTLIVPDLILILSI
jgi:hypothetical protein